MSEPMKLLGAVGIVLDELETICDEDGDETTYEARSATARCSRSSCTTRVGRPEPR